MRYVERNPVRAGMVKLADAYEWSAAAAHCGLKEEGLLIPLPIIPGFIGDWRIWINGEDDPHDIKKIRNTTKTGFPCGSSEFVKRLEVDLGLNLRQRNAKHPRVGEDIGTDLLPFVGKKV